MPINCRRINFYILLIVYTLSLAVYVRPHYDGDFVFGRGSVQLTSHDDAGNCKHLSLSHKEHCILCSVSSGRSSIASTTYSVELKLAPTALSNSWAQFSPSSTTSFSFSRRGPPAPHTIA